MRVVLAHPTAKRRKSFARSQSAAAARFFSAGWRIVEPEEASGLEEAFNIAETGAPEGPAEDGYFEEAEVAPGASLTKWASLDLIQQVPEGPISEILAWVDGDEDRAQAALVVERESSARSTLIDQLEAIANPYDGEKETEL